jgi:Tol biopolymer transport system component
VDGFSWAPDGGRAAVLVDGQVYLWDARSGLATAPLLGGSAVAWSPRGGRLLVTRADGSVAVTDLRGTVIAGAPAALSGATWSPDGRLVAGVRHTGDTDALVVWDPHAGTLTQLASGERLGQPVWSPDGRTLAFAAVPAGRAGDAAAQLNVVAATGGEPRAIAALATADDRAVWSPDSRALYYLQRRTATAPGAIHRVHADGTDDRQIGTLSASALFPGPR